MTHTFEQILPRELVYEGGRTNDAHDPGGRTNKGITQANYNAYRREKGLRPADVFLINDEDVRAIYRRHYWDVIKGDQLPDGVNFAVMDAAVNSGPAQAVRWLQQALAARDVYDGTVDGVIGDKTLQAIEDFIDMSGLVKAVCARRLGTLHRLKTWKYFGKGWAARIANVQKVGCAWASEDEGPDAIDVSVAGGHRKALAADLSPPLITQATAHATTIATGAGAAATEVSGQLQPLQDAMPEIKLLGYVLTVLLVVSIVAGIAVKLFDAAHKAAEDGTSVAKVDETADHGFSAPPTTPAPPVQPVSRAGQFPPPIPAFLTTAAPPLFMPAARTVVQHAPGPIGPSHT